MPATDVGRPVCVDLDGTLVHGDLLWESFIVLLKRHPLRAVGYLMLGVFDRARFKARVAAQVSIEPARLPYRSMMLDYLHDLRRRGACLVLATASSEAYAVRVAEHLGVFDATIASDGETNVRGATKARRLVASYGARGFDYVGNDWSDIPVWQVAARAIAVGVTPRLARHVTRTGIVHDVLSVGESIPRTLARLLRPRVHARDLLVFAALLQDGGTRLLIACVGACAAFIMSGSVARVVRDLLAMNGDRHPSPAVSRPFAAGAIGVPAGVITAGLAFASAALIAASVSWLLPELLVIDLAVYLSEPAETGGSAAGRAVREVSHWCLRLGGALVIAFGDGPW